MDAGRRRGLDTDAGGDYDEENAVCYLQILLADELPGFGRARMMADMDAWGYSFRLGSAQAWFERDAEPEPVRYTVQRGDTLWGIAKAHGVEPWSEPFWAVLGRYAGAMAAHPRCHAGTGRRKPTNSV